jgi:hypothetical protein
LSAEAIEDRQLLPYVFQNGLPLPVPVLAHWTRGHGQSFENLPFSQLQAPALAPGEYRACLVPRDLAAAQAQAGWSLPLQGCDSGYLPGGGTLSLRFSAQEGNR